MAFSHPRGAVVGAGENHIPSMVEAHYRDLIMVAG